MTIEKIKFKRGPEVRVPLLDEGEPCIANDTEKFLIGFPSGNVELAKRSDLDTTNGNVTSNTTQLTKNTNDLTNRGVNPESFGAVGDGITDDSQAIMDTFNHFQVMRNGKGKMVFPHGKTYLCNQPLGTYAFSNFMIDFNGSTLDFANASANISYDLLGFSGSYSTGISLTTDASKLSKTIITGSTAGFVAGDMVRVYSNTIWDSQRTSSRIGEIAFIKSIDSATQLTLTTPLFDTYLVSASAKIEKLNPVENITIMNGTIIGNRANDEHMGIKITLGKSCLISNMITKDIDKRHIVLMDCIDSNVENCTLFEANHASQAYGVSFIDCTRDCIARGNHFTHIRHSMTTNNSPSDSWGIVRRILFEGNTVMDTANDLSGGYGDAIDTHAGCEFISIINNSVNGCEGSGINVEGKSAIIANNRIQNVGKSGIYLRPYVDQPSQFIIVGNEITLGIGDATGSSDYGIYCLADTADVDYLKVANNTVESQISPIWLGGTSPKQINKINVNGNIVKGLRTGSSISVNNVQLGSLTGNTIEALTTGIFLTDSSNLTVSGNAVKLTGTSSTGYGVNFSGICDLVNITGNTLKNAGTITSSVGVAMNATTTYSGAFSNAMKGFTTSVALSTGTGNTQANNIAA
jgi:hypothetical protein